jgi:endonuclease/exonuclease/phosphatase family metal-dependent hydrolase
VTGLRIVTYNLCEGGQDRVSAIAALLRRQHADVIALVEANSRANVDTLGHELIMQVVYGDANSPASVAWLSRLPIRSSSNHRLT